jgi:MOSC domain-containing protein YiiM
MSHGTVVSIHVAPGSKGDGEPMRSVGEVRAVAGEGLEGDRYSGMSEDREVSLIETEAIESLGRDTGLKLAPGDARRNVVTRGVQLNDLLEKEFTVGEVRLRGLRLSEPCAHLAELTDQRVLQGLAHRGGLKAQVLHGGTIHVGDVIASE